MTQPIVIIGTGLAGYMLAKEFRKLDPVTPLEIVTACDGSFYSKPLLSTALTKNKSPQQLVVKDSEAMAQELNAKIHTDYQVAEIDVRARTLICADSQRESIEFSHLVLACGADKIHPTLEGDAVADIQSVNNLQDYRGFRQWLQDKKHIAILGAGLVGCEFANDLINADYKVDIIAPEQHPLASFLPDTLGEQLMHAMHAKGVNWQLGHIATEVDHMESGYRVTMSNGSTLNVEGVLSAIGIRPSLNLAKTAGLATNKGIIVNRWMQTSEPNIFALGDCAEVDGDVKQYVAPLLQCAKALAKILSGGKDPVDYPAMPVVIKTPACPVVSSPPPQHIHGDWHIEGEGSDLRALYHDQHGQLRGFALVGNKVRDKMALAKELVLTGIS